MQPASIQINRRGGRPAVSRAILNRTIFTRNNLHVLRGMASESIDLIYLDPPFNSNRAYAAPTGSKAAGAEFMDVWTLKDVDLAWHGEIADQRPALYKVVDAARIAGGDSMMSYVIYMSVRLMEMHRILKDTGALYLHCDPTAAHYLKLSLDSLFGMKNYRSEITWKRFPAHGLSPRKFGAVSDTILFYSKSPAYTWNPPTRPMSQEMIDRDFDSADKHGRFKKDNVVGMKGSSAKAKEPFRGVRPRPGGGWAPPRRQKLPDWAQKKLDAKYEGMNQLEKMYELDRIGLIYWPSKAGGVPRFKNYLPENPTSPVTSIWDDIPHVQGSEKLGYPTQKPLALLERIIRTSTDESDIILDPFCGCATACSAAERLNRRWIGIDVSKRAYDLVKRRLKSEAGLDKFTKGAGKVIHRTDAPIRKGMRTPDIKDTLYGKQAGNCNGCNVHFQYRNLTVDHIVPTAKGGPDIDENLQLLCGSCNSIKGSRLDMSELRAKLKDMGVT